MLELRRSGEVPDLRSVISLDGGAADLSYDEIFSSSVAGAAHAEPAHGRPPRDHLHVGDDRPAQGRGLDRRHGDLELAPAADRLPARPEHSTYAIIDLYYIGGRHDFTWAMLHQGGTVHVKRSSGFDAEEVLSYVPSATA